MLKEDDSGWWQGEVDGRIGWYVEREGGGRKGRKGGGERERCWWQSEINWVIGWYVEREGGREEGRGERERGQTVDKSWTNYLTNMRAAGSHSTT